MSASNRTGRRRRLLQDGATITASTTSETATSSEPSPRYAPNGSSISFAVARALPQTALALMAVGTAQLVLLVALAWLDASSRGAEWISQTPLVRSQLLKMDAPTSAASWAATMVWGGVAIGSLILYGLRKQRMDDLRGGYRWWIVASVAAFGMSFNAATGLYAMVAAEIGAVIGWSPLPADALWWLLPGALTLGVLATRLSFDMIDSRAASVAALLALLVLSYAWFAEASVLPITPLVVEGWLTAEAVPPLASLLGQLLLAMAMLCFSRRIVLEAQGLVTVAPKATTEKAVSKTNTQPTRTTRARREAAKAAEPAKKETPTTRQTTSQSTTKTQEKSDPTLWVSGGEGDYEDDYSEAPKSRRLSKAERKRLRKLKARRAA